ncbi:MAG: arsenate reductase (glutaredoxin) [Mariprofundus sp.]
MSVTIYHNPRCSKSRATLAILQEQGVDTDIVEYLSTPPSEAELDRILRLLDIEPDALMRKGEAEYKEHFSDSTLSRQELIALMIQHPKVIERPIVINGDKATIGRPPENVLSIL